MQGEGGWNPYEVWRTRVLLPRQQAARDAAEAAASRAAADGDGVLRFRPHRGAEDGPSRPPRRAR